MKRLLTVLLYAVFLWSCHFTDEPHFLQYPFREFGSLPADFSQGNIIWDDFAAPGAFSYTTTEAPIGAGTQQIISGISYWNETDVLAVVVPPELVIYPEAPFRDFSMLYSFTLEDSPTCCFLYSLFEESVGTHFYLQTYNFLTDGVSASLTYAAQQELLASDFPNVTGWGSILYKYSNGRLYLLSDDGQTIFDFSYVVSANGLSDPKESYAAFATMEGIIGDYFLPVTGADTFWGTGRVEINSFYHSPYSDISVYTTMQTDSGTNETYQFIIIWDGAVLSGVPLTDSEISYTGSLTGAATNFIETSDLIVTSSQGKYVNTKEIAVNNYALEKVSALQLSQLEFYTAMHTAAYGEILLFTDSMDTGDGRDIRLYYLPLSYMIEKGAQP